MARIEDNRMLKQALFGRLARAFLGVKLRWKDRVKKNMTSMSVFGSWYRLAQDRKKCYDHCQGRMQEKIARRLEQERAKLNEPLFIVITYLPHFTRWRYFSHAWL